MNPIPQCKTAVAGTALMLLVSVLSQGCAGRHAVIAATGTVLGLDISENPQTQLYHVKFGYNRGELAVVPSNRSAEKNVTAANSKGNGAADTAEVLMELRYGGFGIKSSGGIYQRVAVGKMAVSQPGAAFMMAKDAGGNLSSNTAEHVASTFTGNFSKTPEGDCLRAYWKPGGTIDTNNQAALKSWMTSNNVDTPSILMFLRDGKYQDLRAKAIKDLNVNCQ